MTRSLVGMLLLLAVGLLSANGARGQAVGQPEPPAQPAPAAGATPSYPGGPTSDAQGTSGSPSTSEHEAERLRVWNSPEMKEARAYVTEYGRRSKQFTLANAEQYLAKLERMSPTEMRQWLERFAARQARNVRSAEVAKAARQTAVEQAVSRLQAVQQSYESLNQGQTEGALMARDQLGALQQFAGEASLEKQGRRNALLTELFATNYGWIYTPTLRAQHAAAASVPGDLPPGDPRNFLVGDAPIPGETAPLVGGSGAAAAAGGGAAAAGAAAGGAAAAAGGAGS